MGNTYDQNKAEQDKARAEATQARLKAARAEQLRKAAEELKAKRTAEEEAVRRKQDAKRAEEEELLKKKKEAELLKPEPTPQPAVPTRNPTLKEAREEKFRKVMDEVKAKRAADAELLRQKKEEELLKPTVTPPPQAAPVKKPVVDTDFSNDGNKTPAKPAPTLKNDVDFSDNKPASTPKTNSNGGSTSTPNANFGTPSTLKYDDPRKFTELGISTVDTINNVGTFMSDRILDGIHKSLSKMDKDLSGKENTFTPIAYPTLKLAEESGVIKVVSNDGKFDSLMSENEELANDDNGVAKIPSNKSDNSLGNAEVINPPFQFNKNDDVRSNLSFPKFGRVFNEKINANYPIAVFEVGNIKYNPGILDGTFAKTNDSDVGLTNRIRGGGDVDLKAILGFPFSMAAAVVKTSWKVLTFPATAMLGLNKFARFSVDTALFAKYFNDLSHHLAATMGLLTPLDIASDIDLDLEDSKNMEKSLNKLEEGIKNLFTREPTAEDMAGSYAGIRRRLLFESVVPAKNWGSAESDYIPFLVGKDISISESLNNNTQSNPLAAALNSAAAEAAANKVNGNTSGQSSNAMDDIRDKAKNTLNQVISEQMRGAMSTVVSGEGRVSLPDMWSDSSFSRSISMSFTFTSPYGHPLAIFENTYIPFLMLFCMTSPRQIGSRTFTNPFFVRVNMKGMFSIPLGIIESLSIERGDEKNNCTSGSIPRSIKCSLTIKDLSPTLMMGMTKNKFFALFQGNDGLSSYLNVLGGLSLKDQRQLSGKARRWWDMISERGRGSGARSVGGVLLQTINPFGYAESMVRGARSSIIGKTAVRLSQLNLNPFQDNSGDPGRY